MGLLMCLPPFDFSGCGDLLTEGIGDVVGGVTASAWEGICQSFADAFIDVLAWFSEAFIAFPNVDLASDGISGIFGMSMGLGIVVAAILLLFQAARTAITHAGGPVAEGLIGVGKASAAFMLTKGT